MFDLDLLSSVATAQKRPGSPVENFDELYPSKRWRSDEEFAPLTSQEINTGTEYLEPTFNGASNDFWNVLMGESRFDNVFPVPVDPQLFFDGLADQDQQIGYVEPYTGYQSIESLSPIMDVEVDNACTDMNIANIDADSPYTSQESVYASQDSAYVSQEPVCASQDSAYVSQESVCASQESTYSSQEEAVECFGMICDIQVRASNNPIIRIAAHELLKISNGKRLVRLDLSFDNENGIVLFENSREIGTLSKRIARELEYLQKNESVRYEGFIQVVDGNAITGSSIVFEVPREAIIDINVYGCPRLSDVVASKLSKADLFLQDPHWNQENFPYNNPQLLSIPDMYRYEEEDALLDVTTMQQDIEMPITSPLDAENPKAYELGFDAILDKLAQQDDLVQMVADERIRTPLLSHQKEGLDFILKREYNSSSLEGLWKSEDPENPDALYRHVITGAQSTSPKCTIGGIVADEMGLGKSLTMLSAIVGSLNHGFKYACEMSSFVDSTGKVTVAAKSTLLIVPSELMMDNWTDEIDKHIKPGSLKAYKYHGNGRKISYPELLENDIIITTYATLAAEFSRKYSLLHQITWYRVVLDEAHVIRNPATKQFIAVVSLTARSRWCLTGTPIQNTLEDLGSLVRFLREPLLDDAAQFRRHIIGNIDSNVATSWKDFESLRILLSSICLRRNKTVLSLSESTEHIHELEFTPSEREEYDRLELTCRQAIEMAVSGHKTKEAHQTVLEAILRLRLFCNNGAFTAASQGGDNLLLDAEELGSLLQQQDAAICHYCSCDITSFSGFGTQGSGTVTQCRRAVCSASECMQRYNNETSAGSACPFCGQKHELSKAVAINELSGAPTQYPSKIIALGNDIDMHKHQSKSIVFSFWKKSLDIVGRLFEAKRINYVRVDGTLTLVERKKSLAKFQTDPSVSVLLMTLGTGAVGLNNLSIASRIHILEPQWNPAVESQAIGRVVRLGQNKAVQIVRYMMKPTVEMNVHNRQLRKLQLSKGGFGSVKSRQTKKKSQKDQRIELYKDLINTTDQVNDGVGNQDPIVSLYT